MTIVADAAAAREQIEKQDFHLAVVDMLLADSPAMGAVNEGLDIVETLRSQQPLCRVIALTSWFGNDIGVEAMERGAARLPQHPALGRLILGRADEGAARALAGSS